MFENRMQRTIFGPKKGEAAEEKQKLAKRGAS
jgi:hypothetical protein